MTTPNIPTDAFDFDDLPDLDLDIEPDTQSIATDELPDLELPSLAEPQAPDVLNHESGALPEAPSVVDDAPADEAPVVIEPPTPTETVIEPDTQPQAAAFVVEPEVVNEQTPEPSVQAVPQQPAFVPDPQAPAPVQAKRAVPVKWLAVGGGVLAVAIGAAVFLWPSSDIAPQPAVATTTSAPIADEPAAEQTSVEDAPVVQAPTHTDMASDLAADVFGDPTPAPAEPEPEPQVQEQAPVVEPAPKAPERAVAAPRTQQPRPSTPKPAPKPQPAWQDDALNSLEDFERRL